MISRERAEELVQTHLTQEYLVKHVLAVEAVMRQLAVRLGADEELWGITGLLHDLDLGQTAETPERHGYVAAEMLKNDLPPEALEAIIIHAHHKAPVTVFDKALYCADPITGLITAGVLTHPSKDIQEFGLSSLKKRFKDKRFAAGAGRDQIRVCEEIGIPLDEFLELSLEAMRRVEGLKE